MWPQGTGTNCQAGNLNNPLCDSDARMTLNNTAATVAAFRDALMDESFGKVAHLSPDGIVNTYEPEFSWEPAPGAEKYRLLVGTAWESGAPKKDYWMETQSCQTNGLTPRTSVPAMFAARPLISIFPTATITGRSRRIRRTVMAYGPIQRILPCSPPQCQEAVPW